MVDPPFRVIPGTNIAEIRSAHPDWTEEQCRDEQQRALMAVIDEMTEKRNARRKPRS